MQRSWPRPSRCCCAAWWPTGRWCAAGRQSPQAALDYLRRWCGDATVNAMLGPPDIEGRFFYNAALDGFNFQSLRVRLDAVLDELAKHLATPAPPAIYVGSTTIDGALPGFRGENDVDLGPRDPLASHLDRQPHPHRRPLRPAGQPGLHRGRATPLHAVPAGPAAQPVHRPDRPDARRPAHQPGRLRTARSRTFPALCRRARAGAKRRTWPWRRAVHPQHVVAPRRGAGRRSMCWSTTGGASRQPGWTRRTTR